MALCHVEGTSLTNWSLLVGAGSESEAFESALRFVRYHSELQQDHMRVAGHRVVGSSRLIETPAQDRPDHPSAARTGGV